MSIVLEAIGLNKTIGKHKIVEDISFTIKGGEVFGFLGPNGAGKTTTIRMLVGLIRPTSGEVTICGFDIRKNFEKAMKQVGCIIEYPDLYTFMSGRDNLRHFANMLENVTEEKINEVIRLVRMEKRIDDPVEVYSTGMKQRLGLAQALLGDPKLLILDEPTNGLDPSGIHEFRELIKSLARQKNMAVFVSSHILSEMQLMCDRVAMINHGKLIQTGDIHTLLTDCVHVWTVDRPEAAAEMLQKDYELSAKILNDTSVSAVLGKESVAEINKRLIKENIKIEYVYKEQRNLEDLFLEVTEDGYAQISRE